MIKQFTDEEFLELAVSLPTEQQKYLQKTIDGNYVRVGYVKVTVKCDKRSFFQPIPLVFQGNDYAMIVTPLEVMEGLRRRYYICVKGMPFTPLLYDINRIPETGITITIHSTGVITSSI